MKRVVLILCIVCMPFTLNAQQLYQEGFDYIKLDKPQAGDGDQIEVIEFFWYACSHCFSFEPFINSWKKKRKPEDVKFTLVPAVFHPSQAVHAKAYYAAEAMGVLDITHSAIYNGIHKEKRPYKSVEHMAALVADKGVDREKFLAKMNSFDVDGKARRAQQLARKYPLPGVPTIIVNGRYMATGTLAKSYDRLLDIMDFLVGMEKDRIKAEVKK